MDSNIISNTGKLQERNTVRNDSVSNQLQSLDLVRSYSRLDPSA
jgi:hypothetical protein